MVKISDITFNRGNPTDVDEDFFIDDILITVPTGATFLFVTVPDTYYQDNSDPDGDLAVRLTYTPRNENIDPDHSGNQFAWSENTDWINFDTDVNPGVLVTSDKVIGYAWGENSGWINFGIADQYVVACKVTLPNLINFANDWFEMGGGFDGNLNDDDGIDNYDYAILATWWQDFCLHAWPL